MVHIHGSDTSQGELWHYGIKGMKWGRRKSESSGGTISKGTDSHGNKVIGVGKDKGPQGVKSTSVRIGPKTEVKTSAGGYHEAHPDAVAAKSAAQKKNRSGVDTLSNKELSALADRMNLEQRIRDLEDRKPASTVEAGAYFIRDSLLKEGVKQAVPGSQAKKIASFLMDMNKKTKGAPKQKQQQKQKQNQE